MGKYVAYFRAEIILMVLFFIMYIFYINSTQDANFPQGLCHLLVGCVKGPFKERKGRKFWEGKRFYKMGRNLEVSVSRSDGCVNPFFLLRC